MLEDLAESHYLLNAYAASSDSWEHFRRTSQRAPLFEVASTLCGAWTTLSQDDVFLDGLQEITEPYLKGDRLRKKARNAPRLREGQPEPSRSSGVPESRRPAPRIVDVEEQDGMEAAGLFDVDKLLAREFAVLQHAGMDPVHATRLITDLRDWLYSPRLEPLRESDLARLRKGVPELAAELCEAARALRVIGFEPSEAPAGPPPHRKWVRSLWLVKGALGATAAAATVAANVVVFVGSGGLAAGLGLASVFAGAEGMVNSVSTLVKRE